MTPEDDRSKTGRPGGPPPRPNLRPTSVPVLLVTAVAVGVLAWYGMSRWFADIPSLNWLPGLTLAGLGVVEGVTARSTRGRIERRPGSGPVNPLLIARYAVLAKASSLAGAIFAGAYGGAAVWALSERGELRVASETLPPAVAGLVGSLALTAAGLLLERACRVPPPPEDRDKNRDKNGPSERQ